MVEQFEIEVCLLMFFGKHGMRIIQYSIADDHNIMGIEIIKDHDNKKILI